MKNGNQKIGTYELTDKTTETGFGSTVEYVKCNVCGALSGSSDSIKEEVGKNCTHCEVRVELEILQKHFNVTCFSNLDEKDWDKYRALLKDAGVRE